MMKALFVCHGNICRSPMAEFIFKALAQAKGKAVYAESAAVSTEEIGNPIYPPAQRSLRQHGPRPSGACVSTGFPSIRANAPGRSRGGTTTALTASSAWTPPTSGS